MRLKLRLVLVGSALALSACTSSPSTTGTTSTTLMVTTTTTLKLANSTDTTGTSSPVTTGTVLGQPTTTLSGVARQFRPYLTAKFEDTQIPRSIPAGGVVIIVFQRQGPGVFLYIHSATRPPNTISSRLR